MSQPEVLIVGAGPTGLVLALWLHKQGIKIRIIDQSEGINENSRALVVHARILELYRQLDLAEELVAAGYQLPASNIWVNGQHRVHLSLENYGQELTPYPYLLMVSQDRHEEILEKRLRSLGVSVERRTKLQSFVDNGSTVTATLLSEKYGTVTKCESAYIVGCDGAHSPVRHGIGAKYEGDTYVSLLYIVDLEVKVDESPLYNGEAHLNFLNDAYNIILPFENGHRVRIVGSMPPKTENAQQENDLSASPPDLTFEDVLPSIEYLPKIEVANIKCFSAYRSHHRVAEKFRSNRVFLVGDAAHIHSPVGGQGMNTGIMDAINLAWKLATVIKYPDMIEDAKEDLLNSYQLERRSFALDVVGATDHGFTALTSSGFWPHILRSWIIPYVAPLISRFQTARHEIFRRGSQLVCTYRGSPLSQASEISGAIQPGDRLPWARCDSNDNYSTIKDICWQVHVYGDLLPDLEQLCHSKNIQLTVFPWDTLYGDLGLRREAVYLLRPDQYIAGIFTSDLVNEPAISRLNRYFSKHGLGH